MNNSNKPTDKKSSFFTIALLALAAIFLTLFSLEVAVRFLLPNAHLQTTQIRLLDSSPKIMGEKHRYRLLDGTLSYIHDAELPEFNEWGMFGKNALRKRPGVFRILVLGDSVTEWAGYDYDGFTKIAERFLNKISTSCEVEILNGGHGGYNLEQSRVYYEKYGWNCQADLVILAFVNNDLSAQEDLVKNGNQLEVHCREWIPIPLPIKFGILTPLLLENSRLLPLLLRGTETIKVKFLGNSPSSLYIPEQEKNLQSLKTLHTKVRNDQANFALIHFPHYNPKNVKGIGAPNLHKLLAKFCKLDEIPYLDLLPEFLNAGIKELFLAEEVKKDGIGFHPNSQGHRTAGIAFARFLLQEKLVPLILATPENLAFITENNLEKISFYGTFNEKPNPAQPLTVLGRDARVQVKQNEDLFPWGYLKSAYLTHSISLPLLEQELLFRSDLILFYRSGDFLGGSLATNNTIKIATQNVISQKNERILFYPNGKVLSLVLAEEIEENIAGKTVTFFKGDTLLLDNTGQIIGREIQKEKINPSPTGEGTEYKIFQDNQDPKITASWTTAITIGSEEIKFEESHLTFLRKNLEKNGDTTEILEIKRLIDSPWSTATNQGIIPANTWTVIPPKTK